MLSRRLQASWWRPRPDLLARSLRPLSWLYARLLERKRRRAAEQVDVPVVVVGNLVVGGAGKTPTVLAVVRLVFFMHLNTNRVLRELKRLELQVALVASRSAAK